MIDAFASERHYIDHVAAVFAALPEEVRGTFYTLPQLLGHAIRRGVHPKLWLGGELGAAPTIVASYKDVKKVPGQLIYVQHGVGQTYSNVPQHGSYPGGLGRERVGLFLCPSTRVADIWAGAYPAATFAVVGEPRLDPWHSKTNISVSCSAMPTLAISFHWNADSVAPEAMWAFPHYSRQLKSLAQSGLRVIGHGHPRAMGALTPWYRQAGIEVVTDFHEVLDQADVYACDNSSTLYEFASTGRPVVVLNAPWYRRNVEHGLRFWEYADVGPQVDDADGIMAAVEVAWAEHPDIVARREVVADALLAYRDGTAAARAAEAIVSWSRRNARMAA